MKTIAKVVYLEGSNLTYLVNTREQTFNIGQQSDKRKEAKEYSEKLAEFLGVPFENY